ncbi:MAG: chemotaxis response regulator protein-glutamate methylesterase [Hyphomicrobiales bacterium]|nr:MAG: chemotaxis response regulator protein-glutamate methylesterase [Hyphomicrobiales bacterium]
MSELRPIRVLIVDDSALAQKIIRAALIIDPMIDVIGYAKDPLEARDKIKQLAPDVITLDIEMPNMNGVAFLERLMRLHPMPVVMVSTRTERGSDVTLLALELGAVDFVQKPQRIVEFSSDNMAEELRQKVKLAATTKPLNFRRLTKPGNPSPAAPYGAPTNTNKPSIKNALIAIGSSTGGVEAIKSLLLDLPNSLPPIFIAQHMPRSFTQGLAERLNETTQFNVTQAENGQIARDGDVLIAPGGQHITVSKQQGDLVATICDGETVSGHMPSVDVLFHSVAKIMGKRAVGVILTGMGQDGADGLLNMLNAGAKTIGQSKASCMIYGMPRAAAELGATAIQADLEMIPRKIMHALDGISRQHA